MPFVHQIEEVFVSFLFAYSFILSGMDVGFLSDAFSASR